MKKAVITGISGSRRISYLGKVQEYAQKYGRQLEKIDMWDVVSRISPKPIDEATILNRPAAERMRLFEDALKEIKNMIEELGQGENQDNEMCVAVATHACFHWKSTYLEAFPYRQLQDLGANTFVTIMHNMRDIKENLDNEPSPRFVGITYSDILNWQDRESIETRRWANAFNGKYFIVARNEPAETLYKILFEERTKKVYFSYPMSHANKGQIEGAKKLISELRESGYIVFDPGSIDDARYVKEQLDTNSKDLVNQDLPKHVDDQTVRLDYLLIDQSDLLITRYPEAERNHLDRLYIPFTAGVICEMVHGFNAGKRVYAVWLPEKDPGPFFNYNCMKLFRSEQELLDSLKQYEPPLPYNSSIS